MIGRVSADVLAYLHATALEKRGGEAEIVLQLQNTDQRLSGKETRGSGLVFCDAGRELVASAIKDLSLQMGGLGCAA